MHYTVKLAWVLLQYFMYSAFSLTHVSYSHREIPCIRNASTIVIINIANGSNHPVTLPYRTLAIAQGHRDISQRQTRLADVALFLSAVFTSGFTFQRARLGRKGT